MYVYIYGTNMLELGGIIRLDAGGEEDRANATCNDNQVLDSSDQELPRLAHFN